ncbi:MAG: orotate phosphoribosyltransferase [Calditrichia bacterium]
MEKKEALQIFEKTGALQQGHFLLSSGLHSSQYFQCALVLQYPEYLEQFCYPIYEFYREEEPIDVVIAPAVGGIVVAQELARQFGARAIYAEREGGKMALRRGFTIDQREKVLVCEDVITSGGSVQEVIDLVEAAEGYPIGVGVIVDRSGGQVKFDIPLFSTFQVKAITYKPERCPLCKQGKKLVKPGSRNL